MHTVGRQNNNTKTKDVPLQCAFDATLFEVKWGGKIVL